MNLISSITTVALAGLLLLIPTAYGNLHYRCPYGDPFSVEEVLRLSNGHSERYNRNSDPTIPTGENYTSALFSKPLDKTVFEVSGYIIQVYGNPPKYRLSVFVDGRYHVCPLEEMQ
ncbi:unnamed protein product [Blumeria hordei]|uniref:Candidate secreted effector protein n=2 Tax=Blumeria hordei TaxID=2867405 RepID=A0A383UXV2_BLUHO|nr:putative candidate secreted effector protein [Blumeria hordei DH14]SZF05194.1 unnamed protein product [Blumeria hordei]